MEKNDPRTRRLLELVLERVRRSGRSHRDIERELDLGHGTLGNLFRGRTELRLRHIDMLSKVLNFETADLLLQVYRKSPPAPAPLPVTLEELRSLIIGALRDELDRRERGEPAPEAVPEPEETPEPESPEEAS